MRTYRPTLLATLVSAALSATTANAAIDANNQLVAPSNFDKASVSKRVFSGDVLAQKKLAERATTTGMRSHFDANLGKATFVWGGQSFSKPDLSIVAPEHRTEYAANFYLNQLTGFSAEATNVGNKAKLAYTHDLKRGAIVAKYRQQVHGIEVFNKEYNVMMDREYNLVAGSGYFANKAPESKALSMLANFGSAETALQTAIADLSSKQSQVHLTQTEKKGGYQLFEATTTSGPLVIGQPRTKKVFYDVNGDLVSAYYVEVSLGSADDVTSIDHSYVIDANSGKILFRNNLVAQEGEFTYRVYADPDGFPWEGPHGDVIPAAVPDQDTSVILDAPLVTVRNFNKISTNDPWLTDDATITSGNNAFAYADVISPQGFTDGDYTAEITSDKTFDYQLSGDLRASNLTNGKAGVVNLFLLNNFLHDWWYDHGFDEAAGNAQLLNYGRGGVDGDPLEVQAQDFSGLNNANMATPADGGSPRMQQYLYNSKDAKNGEDQGLTITSHPELGLLQSLQLSSFGPVQYDSVGGEIVRLTDANIPGDITEFDGCEAATNPEALTGKIAIIDRGSCAFTDKVLNAQEAGAIAAIIVNNNDDGTPAPMGGEDVRVTIPNVGLNFQDGHAIYDLLADGDTVTAEMFSNFPLKDSSFDNGIVAHEWGHYIQNRLVGNANGLINFQGRAMGEGWSDFHSMMFLVKSADRDIEGNSEFQVPYATGTYVEDFYRGIRRVPYTPNMEINPLNFRHIESGAGTDVGLPGTNVASPHAAGEVWATVLWDVYVNLLNTHEFDVAQTRMADYLVAGYKLTPISPTYTEARDALLAAMYANDPADYELALQAFARRGMGLGAVSPDRSSTTNEGVIESFNTELASFSAEEININAAFDGVEVGFCSNDNIFDKGETAEVTVKIRNAGSQALEGLPARLKVTSGHDVTIENDGLITFGNLDLFEELSSTPLKVTLNEADMADAVTFEVEFLEAEGIELPAPAQITTLVNMDFTPRATVNNASTDDMEDFASINNWPINIMEGGDQAADTRRFDTENTGFFAQLNAGVAFGEQTMFIRNNDFSSDVAIESHPIEVGFGGNFEVNFWHFYWLEDNFDGGVVEISINGGDWVDVTSVGGEFDVGYSSTLQDELAGRETFTGINGDLNSTAGNTETISFGDSLDGQTVRFRFRVVSDVTVSSGFGWYIDNVTFSNISSPVFTDLVPGDTFACDNSAPKLTLSDTALTVNEGASGTVSVSLTDRNPDDTHTYAWTQVDGPEATLSGADTAELSFTAGEVASTSTMTFQVAVNDGTDTVASSVTVTVNDVPDAPVEPPSSSSSGGSAPWYSVLLLPLLALRRRSKK
ncbi:rhombosortase-dependent M36 family metallopeptidase [Alteromonas sp. a30]|uniref:rhombosortase-dependent M36 family metallopeptidase n=1 Tax=Alteromonas sp. a30 TaxID=2730917 RepID=UPI00227F5FAA|nr:rhombosortase-dependent M36 family metallopeptidase [Alteromonas sp. a30]MCY7294133.1 GlyGly-CTERM sorting domain-containing protein [Alteromonas sp. a30]